MSGHGGAEWIRDEVLPLLESGESAAELVRRLRRDQPHVLDSGAALYFPHSANPDDSIRREVQREQDSSLSGTGSITLRLADIARVRSGSDRTIVGIHRVVTDLLPLPGAPAYIVEENEAGKILLHISSDCQHEFGGRRGNRLVIGTINPGWDQVGGELYYPEIGAIQARIIRRAQP